MSTIPNPVIRLLQQERYNLETSGAPLKRHYYGVSIRTGYCLAVITHLCNTKKHVYSISLGADYAVCMIHAVS